MKLSDHIKWLQLQLETLGDVEVLKFDAEYGPETFEHKDQEYRRVPTNPDNLEELELLSIENYQLSHLNIQQHNESFTAIEELIEEAKHNPAVNELFGDPAEVMKLYMQSHNRDLAIVKAWAGSPRVLVL